MGAETNGEGESSKSGLTDANLTIGRDYFHDTDNPDNTDFSYFNDEDDITEDFEDDSEFIIEFEGEDMTEEDEKVDTQPKKTMKSFNFEVQNETTNDTVIDMIENLEEEFN